MKLFQNHTTKSTQTNTLPVCLNCLHCLLLMCRGLTNVWCNVILKSAYLMVVIVECHFHVKTDKFTQVSMSIRIFCPEDWQKWQINSGEHLKYSGSPYLSSHAKLRSYSSLLSKWDHLLLSLCGYARNHHNSTMRRGKYYIR